MSARGRPLRFLGTLLAGWTGLRVVLLLPVVAPVAVMVAQQALPVVERARANPAARVALAPAIYHDEGGRTVRKARVRVALAEAAVPARRTPAVRDLLAMLVRRARGPMGGALIRASWMPDKQVETWSEPVRRRAPTASRWTGSAFAFYRGDDDAPGLAAASALGGSQVGARLSYRLGDTPGAGVALMARAASPLDVRGAEGAVGLDWLPLAGTPLRLTVERRFDLGGQGFGREAWSAYAAGGFYKGLGANLEIDGYMQAGIVGAKRRDGFVDGALRVSRSIMVGREPVLRLGGGLWGAAQPGVSRLDAGPRAALSVPVGRGTVTGAVEGRFRVAGQARPGSGVAFTLATDF